MNERINWMDWAKFLAVALTIPCHIPQELGAQPVTYFEVSLLACLMFNSGYLKKRRSNIKDELKKYWHQLGIPYIIYNIVFIPYWLIKFYYEHGTMPTLSESMRPIYGALLLQANNSFAEELNPVCLLGMGLYVVSKYNRFTTHYVLVGIFKALVFYYMGYLCRKYDIFNKCILKKDLIGFFVTLSLSIVLFHYHANETYFPIHMLSYFPAVLFGLLAFIYFCKMLNGIRSNIVVNYSNGTMVFIGLHWMLAGFIRYGILKPFFHLSTDHIYTPVEAYALGLLVTILLYPIILFFQVRMPWMLGKRD